MKSASSWQISNGSSGNPSGGLIAINGMSRRSLRPFLRFNGAFALGLLFVTASALTASAQQFNKVFVVSPESSWLEVINQVGSIKVTTTGAIPGKIVINGKKIDGDANINATQSPEGKVKVEVTGRGTSDFEIAVPPVTNLD